MPGRAAGSTRTIALVGPGGAGKTSLAEALLLASETIGRQGSVADGTSVGDASPEARARVGSTELNLMHFDYLDDRYALVSFCDRAEGPDWEGARPRFHQNRVANLMQFREALSKPFQIRLNQRPLSYLERLKAPR